MFSRYKSIALCLLAFSIQHIAHSQIIPPNAYYGQNTVNYVRTWEPSIPMGNPTVTELMSESVTNVKQATQYFDGQARPFQSVVKQATPGQKDMVTAILYDEYGREKYKYMPFVSTMSSGTEIINDGNFKVNPYKQQGEFYNTIFPAELYYYGQVEYENSPLGRPVLTMAAGQSWAGSSRGVVSKYSYNIYEDDVKNLRFENNSYIYDGNYLAGRLVKTTSIDEQGRQVVEFKDLEGKVVLKRVQVADDEAQLQQHDGWLNTYYVYDKFNLLRLVIPPKAVKQLYAKDNWVLTSESKSELCFQYEYDEKNRMIIKKVPGSGEVWMVYDARDRLVMTQDAIQRKQDKWFVTVYDQLNRPIKTGLLDDAHKRDFHQDEINSTTAIEYPSIGSSFELLTETYYDNYSWVASTGTNLTAQVNSSVVTSSNFITTYNNAPLFAQPIVATSLTRGISTGSRVKILGTNKYLYSVVFYDEKGRVIQTQSTNICDEIDINTTQYDWSGKVLRNYLWHVKHTATSKAYGVLTKMTYDHAGRVLSITKNINNLGDKEIVHNQYNELGQLSNKSLGNNLEDLDYSYNIRGWLTGINKAAIPSTNAQKWFAMELAYDKSEMTMGYISTPQFNGNISAALWRTKGDSKQRRYEFAYDPVNRLLRADFTQFNGSNWDVSEGVDFSVKMGDGVRAGWAYDENGNILAMEQMGLKINSSSLIDGLHYTYESDYSNKLKQVIDDYNDSQSKLGDFKYENKGTEDYRYDDNGNLTKDENKKISLIEYNHLNLPKLITVTDKGTIEYVYDALGSKLQKITTESYGGETFKTITTYLGSFVYQRKFDDRNNLGAEDDTLQFISHEEGRVRVTETQNGTTLNYDYFIKDHLGNVRMVLTEEQKQDIYPAATLEGNLSTSTDPAGYEKNFYYINEGDVVDKSVAAGITDYENNNGIANPYPPDNNGNANASLLSNKLYRLKATGNVGATGLGITLKVMSGDKLDVFAKSYYYQNNTNGQGAHPNYDIPFTDILNGFINAPSTNIGKAGVTANNLTTVSNENGIDGFIVQQGNDPDAVNNPQRPRAYVNWILFDEQFNFVSGGFSQVCSTYFVKPHHDDLILQNIPVTKNGYIYVYCSNQSPVDVFFDNLQVVHTRGPLLEETHYYPFGLTMSGISSKAANFGTPENKFKFQGQEFNNNLGVNIYEFRYRMDDPQIGRFWQIDPLADKYVYNSTYAFSENKVVADIELEGLESVRYIPPARLADTRNSYREINNYRPNPNSSYRSSNFFQPNPYNRSPKATPVDIYEKSNPGTGDQHTGPFVTKGNVLGIAAVKGTELVDAYKEHIESVQINTDRIFSEGTFKSSTYIRNIVWKTPEAEKAFKEEQNAYEDKVRKIKADVSSKLPKAPAAGASQTELDSWYNTTQQLMAEGDSKIAALGLSPTSQILLGTMDNSKFTKFETNTQDLPEFRAYQKQ